MLSVEENFSRAVSQRVEDLARLLVVSLIYTHSRISSTGLMAHT